MTDVLKSGVLNQGHSPSPALPAPAPVHHVETTAHAPLYQRVISGFIVFLALAAFSIYVLGVQFPVLFGREKAEEAKDEKNALESGVTLVDGKPHTIEVAEDVRKTLGILKGGVYKVVKPTAKSMRPLVLSGSTALNPSTVMRIRANFAPTTMVKMGQTLDDERPEGKTAYRDLRPGDRVVKGQILAEFISIDVASRKSDMVDAIVQLQVDHEILRLAELHDGSVPAIYLENARRQVKADQSTILRAERQLKALLGINAAEERVWADPVMSNKEKQDALRELNKPIDEVYKDAEDLCKPETGGVKKAYKLTHQALVSLRTFSIPDNVMGVLNDLKDKPYDGREALVKDLAAKLDKKDLERWETMILFHAGQRDPEIEKKWSHVVVKAPVDGIIIERNVNVDETVVDNTINLFQIADVRQLLVIANAPEDDLPALEDFYRKGSREWTVNTVGAGSVEGLPGRIDEISYLIDPYQHTAIIKGFVNNPGDGQQWRIRGGQYISATVRLPPPPDVVEIPMEALVDDGKQAVVFVQTDPAKPQYTMRRVQVTHRFDGRVFVRSSKIPEAEQITPAEAKEGLLRKEPLREGELVLQTAGGELKARLLILESEPDKESK